MEFISNLIKRPISLVLNETSTTMDKYPISASSSLPNTPSVLENKKELGAVTKEESNHSNKNKSPATSLLSFNNDDNNITDFIGVTDDFLDEFKDIPTPPFPIHNSATLMHSILDMDNNMDSLTSITPPPASAALQFDNEQSLSPAMKTSQTIDDLLMRINNNLQQAGIMDEVFAVFSPSIKSELNSKAALNNSKHLTSPSSTATSNIQLNAGSKTCETVAGSTSSTVFENNSLHKFNSEPELVETNAVFYDTKQQDEEEEVIEEENDQKANDQLHNSGVNKSSDKFVGLTEFDGAKVPELPADSKPNLEEQYNVNFEKCFVPALNVQQDTTIIDELKITQNCGLLSSETELASSDNETYADCNDDRDPLANTFAEAPSLDVTTDLESYQSALNKGFDSTLNNTMDNIVDITMEADNQNSTKDINHTQVCEQSKSENKQSPFKATDEEEPMDIDMNNTIEIIHNTSNSIQNVEKVLQHAENVLQHLEDKKSLEECNTENVSDVVDSKREPTKMTSAGSDQAKHELLLNKTIELPTNKAMAVSTECCIMEHCNEVANTELAQTHSESGKNLNLTNEDTSCRTASNSPNKSTDDSKIETKLNSTSSLNGSLNSSKSSAPNSPSFPTKTTQSKGFPQSPKAVNKTPTKSPFLEKSDYLSKNESEEQTKKQSPNGTSMESTKVIGNNLNGSVEDNTSAPVNVTIESTIDTTAKEEKATNIDLKNKQQSLLAMNALIEDKKAEDKRRTFNVESNENVKLPPQKFPSVDETENQHTVALTDTENDLNRRRTFNLPSEKSSEQTSLNTSYEPMEVDDTMPHDAAPPITAANKQITTSTSSSAIQQSLNSSPMRVVQSLPVNDSTPCAQQTTEPTSQSSSPLSKVQQKSQTPPLPTVQITTQSPPLQTLQPASSTPTLPTEKPGIQSSPPLPNVTQNKSKIQVTPEHPPETNFQQAKSIKEEKRSPTSFESTSASLITQPLPSFVQKRPSIRDGRTRPAAETLSAKEQSNIKVKDEKDVFVEKRSTNPTEEIFTTVSATSTTLTNSSSFSEFDQTSSSSSSVTNASEQQTTTQQFDEEFSGNNIILNPADFDYLLTKGSNNTPVDRSSLLLKFDPLLGVPVPTNQGQKKQLQHQPSSINSNSPYLSPPLEEDEHNDSKRSLDVIKQEEASAKILKERSQTVKQQLKLEKQIQQNKQLKLIQQANEKNATMSVDVIKDMSLDNDCNKAFENSNSTQSDEKQINYKMDELEKKIKNEVLKTEDIEKKLKDAEQREEALIKRITEKDKTIAKMNGVIEAYEKAIAELIADKEQLTQHYEKQLAEVKADRDSNYHHLTSLETTFSDLHVKYEKSKEMTCQLKESEEALQAEKRRNLENLHLQEQRYDKMKNHAMQQLEIANKKLESLTREHSIEITKLKALLKKEEIARSSIYEQLAHKTKENAELVKICDELISGQGSNL